MRPPSPLFGFLRLIFENFSMSPKGPPLIVLIFCNRTNVKKFKRVSSFRYFGTMRLLKIRIFFENFSKTPNGPPSIFLKYRKRMDVKKSQRTNPPNTVFGLVRFFKSNNFCLKVRFSQPQHAISDFFSKTGLFHMRLFQDFFFHRSPPSIFTKK